MLQKVVSCRSSVSKFRPFLPDLLDVTKTSLPFAWKIPTALDSLGTSKVDLYVLLSGLMIRHLLAVFSVAGLTIHGHH